MNTYCCGCAYRYPEPDDVDRPRLAASSFDTLRQWQLQEMAPKLIGLPVYINHEMGSKDAPPGSIVMGNRALGIIRRAWVDPKDGSLHWIGELTFMPADSLVLAMYNAGLMPMCSLQHTVSDIHRPPHVITPIEISICHKGRRPGTYICRDGDTAAYMRNNGYNVIIKAMASIPDIVLPDSTALFEEAARVTASNARQVADSNEILTLRMKLQQANDEKNKMGETIATQEGTIRQHQAALEADMHEAETLFREFAKQVFPDTFHEIILPPISISASFSTRSEILERTKKIKKANESMQARLAALQTIAAGNAALTSPIVVTASAKRPAEIQITKMTELLTRVPDAPARMIETRTYDQSGPTIKLMKQFDLSHQSIPQF